MSGAGAEAPAVEPALEWTYDPWRERPALAGAALAFALLMCAVLVSLRESLILTAGLALVAVAALAPLFTRARCRVAGGELARRGPLGWDRRPWRDVRRARLTRGGLLVSPYPEPHWLDAHRALFLPLPRAAGALPDDLARRLDAHGFGA